MSIFPYLHCPTASELFAYVNGSSDATLREQIELHVNNCSDCARSLRSLGDVDGHDAPATTDQGSANAGQDSSSEATGFLSYVSRHRPEELDQLQSLLAKQQERVAALERDAHPEPMIGQFWTVRVGGPHQAAPRILPLAPPKLRLRAPIMDEALMPFLVLLLDSYYSEARGENVVNIVPVTEDKTFAADWSLVVDHRHSGVGGEVVIHLDMERSASAACLERCIGRLPKPAGDDLVKVARAWNRSESPPQELAVSQLGRAAIRVRADWQLFETWLAQSTRLVCESNRRGTWDERGDLTFPPDSVSNPTGPAGDHGAPKPEETNPWADPSRHIASNRQEGLRALSSFEAINDATAAEISPLFGVPIQQPRPTPSSTAMPLDILARTVTDAIRELLNVEYEGSFETWARTKRQAVLDWDCLAQYGTILMRDLDRMGDGMQRELFARASGYPLTVRQSIFKLVSDAKRHWQLRTGLLDDEVVSARAARHKNPGARPPKRE